MTWTLRQRAIEGAIVGSRCPDQIAPVLAAAELELTGEAQDQVGGAK